MRTDSDRHGFLQRASHELLHQVKQESLDPYEWFSTQASHYLRAGAEAHYGRRLAATGADVVWIDVCEEIHADVTGDARADPRFLQTIATQNPSKFTQFTETVVNWLESPTPAKASSPSFRLMRSARLCTHFSMALRSIREMPCCCCGFTD